MMPDPANTWFLVGSQLNLPFILYWDWPLKARICVCTEGFAGTRPGSVTSCPWLISRYNSRDTYLPQRWYGPRYCNHYPALWRKTVCPCHAIRTEEPFRTLTEDIFTVLSAVYSLTNVFTSPCYPAWPCSSSPLSHWRQAASHSSRVSAGMCR